MIHPRFDQLFRGKHVVRPGYQRWCPPNEAGRMARALFGPGPAAGPRAASRRLDPTPSAALPMTRVTRGWGVSTSGRLRREQGLMRAKLALPGAALSQTAVTKTPPAGMPSSTTDIGGSLSTDHAILPVPNSLHDKALSVLRERVTIRPRPDRVSR